MFHQNHCNMITMKLPPIQVGISEYIKAMQETSQSKNQTEKEKVRKRMLELYTEYREYYHQKYLPLFGYGNEIFDRVVGKKRKGSRTQVVQTLDKNHPFFELI